MKYGSVCSGIEAATQAWHPLGWRPAFFSEIEKFPSAVLAHHYPDVPNHGDMTKFEDWPDHAIDLLVGGTPCQSFSVAGLRKGLADPRGNLMLTFGAVARRYRPRWIVWENVPGVLSSDRGRDFGTFLGMLAELGYGFAYRVLDAQYVRTCRHARAVPQRRRRVFVVGYLGDWRRAAAVLFDGESLSGNPPPRREAGKGLAALTANGVGTCGADDSQAQAGHLIASSGNVPHCLNAGGMGRIDYETETIVAHALRGDGFDASEDGTGRGTPLVAVAIQERAVSENPDNGPQGAGFSADGAAYTLEARNKVQAVAFDCKGTEVQWLDDGSHPTLRSMGHSNSHQNAGGHAAVMTEWAVRRLTPVECERLQGFPQQSEMVIFSAWLDDKSHPSADAAIRCITGRSNAWSAGEGAQQPNAETAAQASNTSQVALVPPVALHVHIDLERELIQLQQAGKLIWSASIADQSSASPLSMPAGDFAHLVALTTQTAAKLTMDGRVASRTTERLSSHLLSGKTFVGLSGREIAEHAAAVERFTAAGWKPSMPTISPSIANIPPSVSTLTTLCCCVVNAIASCIPETIIGGNSYSLSIEAVSGFTHIPYRGKPADKCPDGPRYKALGNSMAVNVMTWIGERIALVEGMA